jgi:hypothetical protein
VLRRRPGLLTREYLDVFPIILAYRLLLFFVTLASMR